MINSQLLEDLCICDVSVISGIRPKGRSTDNSRGRRSAGILFVWKGEATFYFEGQTLRATDGELVFLPRGMRYRMTYTAPSTTYVVVNFGLRDKNGAELFLLDGITVLAKDDATHRIAQAMTALELCGAARTGSGVLRKKELVYRLLGLVYSLDPRGLYGGTVDPKIAEGVQLLEQSYLENLPIATYAAASHLSVNGFRALFHKQFGTSPVKYRNHLRLERARELLLEGSLSVAEVAYASGFENLGYFCRYYRQVMGEAPGDTKHRASGGHT